jgi:hypothetical protein
VQLWIYSEAFINHISARKDMYMPFYWLCNFGSILKPLWSTFQSHLCIEGHVLAFILAMQLWIYSEAFLRHFYITSLQRRTFACLSIDLKPWIYSEAFLKHFSIMSLERRTCTCLSINYAALDLFQHFWSTFQSHPCNVHAFLLTMQLLIYSEALLKHFSIKSLQRMDGKVL